MELKLIVAFRSELNTELTYMKGIVKDKVQIETTKDESEAMEIPFNKDTYKELFRLPKLMTGLCLAPIFIFKANY